jgi:hypothetical protein
MTRSGFEPRTAAVGSQRLTAWTMARPLEHFLLDFLLLLCTLVIIFCGFNLWQVKCAASQHMTDSWLCPWSRAGTEINPQSRVEWHHTCLSRMSYRRDGDRWEWNMVKWWLGREDWSTTVFHSTWTRFLLNSGLLHVILLSRILILGSIYRKQRIVYCRVGAWNLSGRRPWRIMKEERNDLRLRTA